MVHLVLYNITIAKTVKYYDFHGAMIPFFVQHWESLQLGDVIVFCSFTQFTASLRYTVVFSFLGFQSQHFVKIHLLNFLARS